MNPKNPKVDFFFQKAKAWREEMEKLREILLRAPVTEELKWGQPCYQLEGKNLFIISGFKEYCLLAIFNGALLKDPAGVLVRPGENTQAARQIRFTSVKQIVGMEPLLAAYVAEAIEAQKAGLQVEKVTELVYPPEFQEKLASDPDLSAAFDALTPGRRRAYNLFFCAPKQSKTRTSRIEKCIPKILEGKGLDDR